MRLVLGIAIASLAAAAPTAGESRTTGATFACADGKSIEADFYLARVSLRLSDGRRVELERIWSEPAELYADAARTMVFTKDGDIVSIREGADGAKTYADCERS
jgi:hypothetical protein